jgi:hypothetical protein
VGGIFLHDGHKGINGDDINAAKDSLCGDCLAGCAVFFYSGEISLPKRRCCAGRS